MESQFYTNVHQTIPSMLVPTKKYSVYQTNNSNYKHQLSNKSILYKHPSHNYYINDVRYITHTYSYDNSIQTCVSEELNITPYDYIYVKNPLLFRKQNLIHIPSKVENSLRTRVSKKMLKNVHEDIEVAIELCLLFASLLTSTYFNFVNGENEEGWKPLKSSYLRDLLKIESSTYKAIREVLEKGLKNDNIIECDYESAKGIKCYGHRLGENYLGKGVDKYELKTDLAKELWKKNQARIYNQSLDNIICTNLIDFYPSLTLPSYEEVLFNSKILVKNGHTNKKGKKIKSLGKHSKSYYSDHTKYTFIEDGLKIYQYLTDDGLNIPTVGSEYSGGRIVDSLTLMPSYIRNMITINGEPIVECDFVCLHPNIAISIYGGKAEYLTHQKIAEELSIDLKEVKKEHLSFFNKHPKAMEKSPLYQYYMKNEPEMMTSLINEKYKNKRKYKITSQIMFEKEVLIMTHVIQALSKEGIRVGYVYDALLCAPKDVQRVKEVMDYVVLRHGVKTSAKIVN
jgi:hypothetical protein